MLYRQVDRERGWPQHAAMHTQDAAYGDQYTRYAHEQRPSIGNWAARHMDAAAAEAYYHAKADGHYDDWHAGGGELRPGPASVQWGRDSTQAPMLDHPEKCVGSDGAPPEYLGWGRIDKPPRPAAPTFGCPSRGPAASGPCHNR
jgi:hypothetical protein